MEVRWSTEFQPRSVWLWAQWAAKPILWFFSPLPEFIIGIDTLSSWQKPLTGFLNYGVRTIMVGKVNWKPLDLPFPRKIVNQKRYHIPGEIIEISVTIKDLEDAGVVIPTHSYSNFLFGLCRRQMDLGEWQWLILSLTTWWLQLLLLHRLLMSLDISSPGSKAFGLRLNYATSFPGSLVCRWQIMGLLSIHNYVSKFL